MAIEEIVPRSTWWGDFARVVLVSGAQEVAPEDVGTLYVFEAAGSLALPAPSPGPIQWGQAGPGWNVQAVNLSDDVVSVAAAGATVAGSDHVELNAKGFVRLTSDGANYQTHNLGQAQSTRHGILIGRGGDSPVSTAAPSDGQILVGQSGADPEPRTVSGDATLDPEGVVTLASTLLGNGTVGSASQVPLLAYDAKGRLIGVGSAPVAPPASSVTGAGNLTAVNDTNVQLTLGGTPVGALLKATSITVSWTGLLALSRFAQGAAGQLLIGQGATAPAYKTLSGDATIDQNGVVALKNTGSAAGPVGNATTVPIITTDAKGRVTALSSVAISYPGVSSGDLSANNDTNVQLTLGGTPAGAVLHGVSLTVSWSGRLALSRFADAGAGQMLIGQGAASDPAYQAMSGDGSLAANGALTLAPFISSTGLRPAASANPVNNGDLAIEATNDTTLTFKLKGSDGVTRSATLTLA